MFGLTILDLALILMLLSYLIYGLRNGFMVTLGGIAGFVVGAIAAFMAVPLVSGWVTDSGWRLTARWVPPSCLSLWGGTGWAP